MKLSTPPTKTVVDYDALLAQVQAAPVYLADADLPNKNTLYMLARTKALPSLGIKKMQVLVKGELLQVWELKLKENSK